MLLTVEQFKEFVPDVALSDDVLRIRLDRNERAIEKRVGPVATNTERIYSNGQQTLIRLKAEAQTINSVTDVAADEAIAEDATDGYLPEGSYLRRKGAYWPAEVLVEYVPRQEAAERIVVLVDLMRCDLNYEPGMAAQSTGGWQEAYAPDHLAVRENILDQLEPRDLFA